MLYDSAGVDAITRVLIREREESQRRCDEGSRGQSDTRKAQKPRNAGSF